MNNSTLVKTIIFTTSREIVWAFLTDKEKLAQWFHPAVADLAVGEDYSLVRTSEDGEVIKQCWGTVLEMNKPSRLVYSFTIAPLNGAMTTVTWELEEIEGGTKLSLTHEGIANAAGEAAIGLLTALDKGWDVHADSLRKAIN